MKTILVTGGSGFIGKNISESYLNDKYKLIFPSSSELNLCDTSSVDKYLKKTKIDIVIHTAIKPGHRNATLQSNILEPNLQMLFNIERHSNNLEKIIVTGSGAVYDNRFYQPKLKEEQYEDHIPVDEYGFGKYIGVKVMENRSNMVDLRLFGIFGKYEDYAIRFISNAICKSIFDMPITIKQNRNFDYLYVKDLMPVLEYFIENTHSYTSYNVTPDKSLSLYNIAQIVKTITGNRHQIIVAKKGMGSEYSGDNTRLRNEIPDLKLSSLNDSIKELYNYYICIKNSIEHQVLMMDK